MMNDTEFENILKQALRPDISDEEILVKKTPSKSKRRKSTMRKHRIIQSAVAAAACLALIFGIGYNGKSTDHNRHKFLCCEGQRSRNQTHKEKSDEGLCQSRLYLDVV